MFDQRRYKISDFKYTDKQYRTDLPIDTMIRFEHGPIMWPGLTGANVTIFCSPAKIGLYNKAAYLSKNWPLVAKIRFFALMNSPY